ncbi:hypothetical protein ACLB2K_066619 [Fragaria x ananassa]
MIKLNVDGGLDQKNGLFGMGAVCRDDQGDCVGILATLGVGFPSPYSCEMMALRNGLHFCVQVGFTHVEVECDCQAVVNAINLAEEDLSPKGAIVDEIRTLPVFFSLLVCVLSQEVAIMHHIMWLNMLFPSLFIPIGAEWFRIGLVMF